MGGGTLSNDLVWFGLVTAARLHRWTGSSWGAVLCIHGSSTIKLAWELHGERIKSKIAPFFITPLCCMMDI